MCVWGGILIQSFVINVRRNNKWMLQRMPTWWEHGGVIDVIVQQMIYEALHADDWHNFSCHIGTVMCLSRFTNWLIITDNVAKRLLVYDRTNGILVYINRILFQSYFIAHLQEAYISVLLYFFSFVRNNNLKFISYH